MNSIPLPACQDDILRLLHNGRQALRADSGDAQPDAQCLQRFGLQLEAILVTRDPRGHIGGVEALPGSTDARFAGAGAERLTAAALSNVKAGGVAEPGGPKLIHYIQRCEELRELELDALTRG